MNQRAGGEIGISNTDFLHSKNIDYNFLFKKKKKLFLDLGRSAIFFALLSILSQGGLKKAWLPAFCCQSLILPFKQLGFEIQFYSMGNDLVSPNSLPDRIDGATFLFINYFGKKNQAIIRYLEQIPKSDNTFFIIEDNAQAALSTCVGGYGDYVVYSFRKFLPQPDGAVLAFDNKVASFIIEPPDESFISDKLIGKIIRENNGNENVFLSLFNRSENSINQKIIPRKMSTLSEFLFERTDFQSIVQLRKRNFCYLSKCLKTEFKDKFIEPLYDSLKEGEVPLGFPIRINNGKRDDLRRFLMIYHIYCPIHWRLDTERLGNFAEEALLSNSILTLPIDQKLTLESLDYLLEKLKLFYTRFSK